ncbi:unnamed protein product [Phytophthora fragariaefolia]|uniref:RxLR effector protein n=1 Tax=Phytophthora fragariaefolia TaxID=1490495 RepID=A0A9W6U7Q2_9STRA|nr:unnamed protein product [Phytophthora fragariaefolia]
MFRGGLVLVAISTVMACSEAIPPITSDNKSVEGMKLSPVEHDSKQSVPKTYPGENKDDEERGFDLKKLIGLETTPNDFAKKILKKMTKNDEFKLEMFAKWKDHELSVGEISLKLNVPYSDRFLPLLIEYINHVYPSRISEVARNQRVRFGKNQIRYFDDDETLEWLRNFGR